MALRYLSYNILVSLTVTISLESAQIYGVIVRRNTWPTMMA